MSQPTREIARRIAAAQRNYSLLCAQLRKGHRLPMDVIDATVEAAKKTWHDLVGDVLAGNGPAVRSGSPCPECSTPMRVYASRPQRDGQGRIQYIGCPSCKYKPPANKVRVPAELVRRRRPRKPRCRGPPRRRA